MQENDMPITKKRATRVGRAAVLGAVTVGLTAGLTAAPASAAPAQSGATVRIHNAGNGYYKLYISGTYAMSEHDAHGYINNIGGGGIRYTVFGDDPETNDIPRWSTFYSGASRPTETPGGYLYATPEGIRFFREVVVLREVLNEDSSWTDDLDEIYVSASFIDGDGGRRTAYSNSPVGWF
jgi:hypothetical protein